MYLMDLLLTSRGGGLSGGERKEEENGGSGRGYEGGIWPTKNFGVTPPMFH